MGSSGSGAGDCRIGPIVWVRRRNGSWWPGKILDPDELAECNLTSPRSGTPVKLLGREDASVDWYNLEKSKRVKAFRCGEFDDCIERAESAQGMPIKKREKYARREDAIIHALELEKELSTKEGKLGAGSDKPISNSCVTAKKEPITSEGRGDLNGQFANAKSNQFAKRVDADRKDGTVGCDMHTLKAKDGNQQNCKDDQSEATPRMRGLQDFGLGTAPLKRKLSSYDSDDPEKPMADNQLHTPPGGPPSPERATHMNGVEQIGSISRAKRSRCIYSPAESDEYSDDRGLMPSQINMFPPQFEEKAHPHSVSLNEGNSTSGFMEDIESDSSQTDSSEPASESDSSETEPDMNIEMTAFPGEVSRRRRLDNDNLQKRDCTIPMEAERVILRQPEAPEHGSTTSEELDESGVAVDVSHFYHDDPFLASEAVSKWQLKGKRNIRHLTKRTIDRADGRYSTGPLHGNLRRMKGSTFGQRVFGDDDSDFDRNNFGTEMVGLDNGGYLYSSRFAAKAQNSTMGWEGMALWDDQPSYRGWWEERGELFNPGFVNRLHFGGQRRSMLVEVDLKVQASYKKERVPIVSLMSKLNGKAIIGHPIQIETLEDGSTETLISTNDYYNNEAVDKDGNPALPPAWRTARRTNSRVPRPHLSMMLDGDATAFVDQEKRRSFKKSNRGFGHKESLVRKSHPHTQRQLTDRKFLRKQQPKKGNLLSSQKTRTLSSIGIQQNFGLKSIRDTKGAHINGLIKPETSGPTTVACIPVKLVFSRLLEKINRPPSEATSKMVLSYRNTERQPS